ncbi:hypothetical protein [Streptomyces sp. MMS20-AI2-20]|uniref:hypothetical protein n=1 Tax=Streptomyces sp. MMS20-AI2-20 TaxID=2925835 RepID=UPI001F604770|nr:hypothetical protein [Streptomyces sp. MMS20-AI2-20]MCI4142259.1 hypothetical protein [Streptomyces sp. MMS20-AI2-20]
MTARDDARDVGLLLRYGLDPTMSPARHDVYSRLLDRFHTDPDLRTAFDETADGLGLRVLTADRSAGLVLIAEPTSPLAVTDVSVWLRIRGTTDRLVYGLALGGATAWCYPTARAVREPGTRRVTALDVDRLVREHAAAIEAEEITIDGGLGEAWREYATNRKQVALTSSGRLKRDCTVRMCEDVLLMLASFGLIVADRTVPPPRAELKVWRSTDRFRAHVATAGGPLVWQTIIGSPAPEGHQHDSRGQSAHTSYVEPFDAREE